MKINPLPPKEYLHECFQYLENGDLIWKQRPRHHFKTQHGQDVSNCYAGKVAGRLTKDNYLQVGVSYLGKVTLMSVHRIIWTMHNGPIPEGYLIDHWDTNKFNNRIDNLRPALVSNNAHNANLSVRNTSGVKGVSRNDKRDAWEARLCLNFNNRRIGYYKTIEEAESAVKEARLQLHEEFTNHG